MVSRSPVSVTELLERSRAIAGLSLSELAAQLHVNDAVRLSRAKGWSGQLLEQALGASAGSLAQPDFPHLGVELKSIPVNAQGQPVESTWVCMAPLQREALCPWEQSVARAKLSCVLWIPILASPDLDVTQRRIGQAFLWQPNDAQSKQLHSDYNEHCELIAIGQIEQISAAHGEYLQIRPKAANRGVLTDAIGPDGKTIQTLPRGFYLRQRFTRTLLQQHYW